MNKKMLTVEDVNSVIAHFSRGFADYYILDTSNLTTVDTYFAYDFIDVYRVTGSISFKINNALWTGGYRVLECNISGYSVSFSDGYLVVSGTGISSVKLLLELSPEFSYDSVFELDFNPVYTPVIRPFYESMVLTMGFLDGEEPVSGLSITDKTSGGTLTTDSDGLVTVTSDISKAGDYDYVLECTNNSVTVDYNFPYQRIPVELPVALLNSKVYRDKVNVLEFKFLFDSGYNITESMLFSGNSIRLRVDGQYYSVKEYTGSTFRFEVPIGFGSHYAMQLVVGGNDYVDNYTVVFEVDTEFISFSTGSALKSEVESSLSAGTVYYTGSVLDAVVNVSRDVNIVFTGVTSSSLDSVFTVKDGAVLGLDAVSFTGKSLVTLDNGDCNVLNGSFTHSTAPLFTGTGDLTIKDSSFIDNYSCIDLIGDVDCYNVLFDLSDSTYLDTTNPAFVKCYRDLTLDFCRFNLDLHNLSSLGLSYVMLLLGSDGSTNNVSNKDLLVNESFPIKKNTSEVDVESTHYHITNKSSKCMIWTVENTNTVYSNQLNVEYVEGD